MDAIETALRGDPVDLDLETRPELVALRGCPQTEAFHAEGDVAEHSRRVYDLACEHANDLSGTDQAALLPAQRAALRLAGLLHDLGKPATTKENGPGRWSAHGHDLEGARLVSSLSPPTRSCSSNRWGCTRTFTRWSGPTCGPTPGSGSVPGRRCGCPTSATRDC
jgi:putative nucleotidyltransferase with HDIG domain